MTEYTIDGKTYNVSEENLEKFMEKFPNARKASNKDGGQQLITYYNREGEDWKQYHVRDINLQKFREKFPEARTQEGWKDFGEKQKTEIEDYNKAIAEANTKKEKERLEEAKKTLEENELKQQNNRDEVALRFKKEIESDYSKEQNWFSNPKELERLRGYSHEEKVKWLNDPENKVAGNKKYVAELDFEDTEFDIDKTILDESKLDIPQPINVMGVMTSQPEDSEDTKLGDDFYEDLKKYNADIQNVLSNPIKGEDDKVDYVATQAAIDEIEANAPSALEVKDFSDVEDLNLTVSGLGEGVDPIEDSFEVNLSEKEQYALDFKNQMKDYGFIFNEAKNIFEDSGNNVEYKYNDNLSEQENENRKKAFDQLKEQGRHIDFISKQVKQDLNSNFLEKRKEKLQQYENGEIELSMVELAEIANVDQGMKDYMEKFLPSPEEILEMEDPDLDNTKNVLNAVQAATQAAVMNDPRFQFIQENIIKEVDTQAKSKLEEIRNKYKLDEGITQEKLEGIQKDFANWYNDSVSDKIQNNKKVTRIFQEYGLATEEAFQGLHQDFVRYKEPFFRQLDDTSRRYEDDDSIRGILKRGNVWLKENWDKQGPVVRETWNKNMVAAKNLFFADPLRKDIKRIKEDIIGRSGITADTTIREAKKLWDENPENVNKYGNQTLLPVSARASNDMTIGELLTEYEGSLKGWKESTDLDVVEQLEAMEELSKYKTYDSGKPFGFDLDGEGFMGFTLEGFLDRLAGLVDQAPHMIPSTIGKGLVAAGTVATATGVAAGPGVAAIKVGTGFIALGSMVQGAMEYGGTYMDGVRRKLTAELKEQGIDREPTAEEFMKALENPEAYTDQGAALTAGGVVMGTEFLADYITGKLTGTVGGAIATTSLGKAVLANTFTRYLASVGVSGLAGQKINAYQEYLTEGFQEYLGQVADNYIDKFTHDEEFTQVDNIFTSNLKWDEIYESAEQGYKQGELFGSVAILSTGVGLSGLKKSYIQQAEDIAYNINMRPGSRTYKVANAAFKRLEQNIRDDKSLSKAEMLKRINELSRIREASMLTPDNVTGRSKVKLMKLLIEQRQLKNEIKATDNKDLSVDKIERKAIVDQQIQDLIKNANQVSESLKGDTVSQSIVPTGSKGKNIDTLAKEYKKNPGSANIESLLNQYQKIALKALGFDSQKGTVKREDAVSFVDKEFGKILESWDPSKGALSTYITATIKPKKSAFYGKEEQLTEKGKSTRLEDTQELQADQDQETQGKEYQEKGSPSSVAAIEETLGHARPNILAKTKQDIKQFIASSLGKVRKIGQKGKTAITKFTPAAVAKSLVNAAKDNKTRALLKKGMGNYTSNKFKKFIEKAINDGLIDIIPFATMKKRFTNVPGFNIDKIGREKGTAAGTGIYKLSGLEKQALIDYYTSPDVHTKKRQKRYNSLVEILAEGMALEQFQEMKTDKDFMNDLSISLKDSGSELTAEQFVDELEKKFDKRTPEKRSLDKIDRFITTKLDPIIDQYKGTFGSLNPAAFAQAFKTGLRAYQKAIKNGLSFAESLQKLINSFVNSFKLNSQQKAAFEKGVFEKIKTEAQLMGKTLIEIMQTSGINVIAKYIEGDVTVNNKNRPARQESVLQSVIKGKIPGQLLELLGLANFGRKKAYGNANVKFDTKVKAQEALGKGNVISYAVTTNGQYFDTNTAAGKLTARTDWAATKGDLYYGKTDPAYVKMMEAANKYNKKKFDKVQRIKIPFVKDKNGKKIFKKLTKADKKANKAQEKINMQALEDLYTILAKRDKNGKLIIPLNDSALLISQSYQGTDALIKIAAPFAGVSQRLIGGQIEEHSPPASSIGAAMIWGIANNQSELIMQGIKDNYIQVQLSISTNNKLNAADLAETSPDGMSIITPNVGILRLAAAGANLNTITDLETGKSFADKAGLPLPNEFKSNPIAVKDQNQLLVDIALKPELTLEKARENLKVSELTWNKKTVQVKNNAKNLAPEFLSKDQTTSEQKETLENSQDTQVNAQKVNKKKKGISVFDFDDTLAKTKEKVIVTMRDGTIKTLSPAEFAQQALDLESEGASFDFSQFEDVKGAKKGPLADLALKRQGKFGSGDIFILTARPQTSAQGIKTFLDGIGLNIPIENITGLEDGTSQAKADWVLSKTKEGYNDFYFADDAIQNVKAVKQILDQVDVKSKVQQAIADKATTLDEEFNKQIEEVTGKEAYKEYSPARAKLEGKAKDKGFFKWLGRQLTMTPSVEDFMGLMYDLIGKGKQGNKHAKFILDKLMKPFNKAEQAILSAKVTVANDFAALKKAFPSLRTKNGKNPLMQKIGIGPFTKSNAIRVYMWAKQGMDIPGLSQRDQNALVKAVESDMELKSFADNVMLIQKENKYPPPSNNWTGGDITTDILQGLDKGFRNKLMTEFNENAAIIFSEKNMNKLEAIYGTKWVEALKDSLRRMKSGSNRPVYQGGGSRIVNEMLDWLNGSVGAIMFLNMRSGLLQLISNVNFINWGDNNMYQAAKAFASKEYWPTVMKLMNSDYLVNRRDGLKINVNEAELADAANKSGMKGAIAYLLDKGFIITRIMDSLAIATGGATFYMNRRDALLKRQNPETGKKYTKAEAETQAFDDFYAIAEETQQSSNPSKISQQQASLAGRVILSFQNVTMQYNRKVKKSIRNLYNRRKNPGMTQRESDMSNLSQIVYYTTIQNVIFHSLQQTLFALLFDDETDDEEKDRAANIANGMLDSLLFGLGFGGAAISTVKNVLMKIGEQGAKKNPKYEEAVWSLFDFSPVLDSKVRKIKSGLKTFSWNMEEIKKRGWSLDNPAYLAIAQMISATTNIPIDRVLRKTMNLRAAMDEETRTWQRVALILGWDTWSLGLPYWGLQSTIEKEDEEKAKIKASYKSDIRKMKASGYKKVMAIVLKDYDPKDIIELRSPAGTVVYYAKANAGKQAKN